MTETAKTCETCRHLWGVVPLRDGVVTSHNVMEQIAYKDAKSAAGKASGRKRAGNAKSTSKSTCFNT